MESLKDSCSSMTYGVLEKQSEIVCRVLQNPKAMKSLKLMSDKIEEK
jgi:hypothetical protein